MNSSATLDADADRTAVVYRTAGELLFRCAGYWEDEQQRKEDWRIHYVVDTDILVSYLDPNSNGRYAELFGENRELPKVLVRMMSDFIIHRLQSGVEANSSELGQLLLISPHDQELHGQFRRVQEDMAEWIRRAESEAKEVLEHVRQGGKSEQQLVELLIKEATALIEVFEGSGPFEKAQRLSRISAIRLTNVQRYVDPATGFTFPTPPEDLTHPEFHDYVHGFEQWRERLAETRGRGKSDWAVSNDAQVLNHLSWINRKVAPQRRRLVLITGSRNIFVAARQPPRGASDAPPVAGLTSSADGEYQRLYLRHPQAFLGHWQFFETENRSDQENSTELRIFSWLNVLYPNHIDLSVPGAIRRREELAHELEHSTAEEWSRRARELRAIAAQRAGGERPQDYIDSIISEWDRQVRVVAVEKDMFQAVVHSPKTKSAQKLLGILRMRLGDDLMPLLRDLAINADNSRASLLISTVVLSEVTERNNKPSIRGVPALRFDDEYSSIQARCNQLQDDMFNNTLEVDLKNLNSEFGGVDPEQYHALVVYALIYAIRGHWQGTRTLCLSALAVVDGIPPAARANRTGREAAYLLAVAERRVAREASQLDNSRRYLQMAERREHPNWPRDVRFMSEELACDVAALALGRLSRRSKEVTSISVGLVGAMLDRGQRILAQLDQETLGQVRNWVTRQVFSSVLGLALLVELDKPNSTLRWQDELNQVTAIFRKRRLAPDEAAKFRDVYSDVIYWAAQAVYEKDGGRRRLAAVPLGKVIPERFPLDQDRVAAYVTVGKRAAAGAARRS